MHVLLAGLSTPSLMAAPVSKLFHHIIAGEGFKARALDKSGKIIAAHSSKVTSSKDLKGTAGIGKGSMGYVCLSTLSRKSL